MRRKKNTRKTIGTAERPRLAVYRSLNHIYAQLIDDTTGQTKAAASSLKKGAKNTGNVESAKSVGKAIAKAAIAKGIKRVFFDRGKFVYHGRVAALAQGAREEGLEF